MDTPYIIYPHGSLSSRLATLLTIKSTEDQPIICYWPKTRLCNGLFSECFEPIDGITFRYEEPAADTAMDFEGVEFEDTIDVNLLRPIPEIRERIINNVRFLNDFDAIHVRRTDFKGKRIPNEEFFSFIDEGEGKTPIFLAADDVDTQIVFSKKYKGLLRINRALKKSSAIRQSTISDAVVDMFVCAGAKFFMGTDGSSFTDMIELLRSTNCPYSYNSMILKSSIIPDVVVAEVAVAAEVAEVAVVAEVAAEEVAAEEVAAEEVAAEPVAVAEVAAEVAVAEPVVSEHNSKKHRSKKN